jgi:hypothetical protein
MRFELVLSQKLVVWSLVKLVLSQKLVVWPLAKLVKFIHLVLVYRQHIPIARDLRHGETYGNRSPPCLNSRFFSPGACVSDAAPTNASLAPPRTFLCSRSMANQLTRSSPSAKLVHGRGARNSISSFQSFGARPGISPVPVAGDDEENIFFVSLPAARVRGSFSSKGRKTKQISIRSPPTFFC